MIRMLTLLILSMYISGLEAIVYDSYSGKPATKDQIEMYNKKNNTRYCLIDVKPCDENEWRRIDASCYNLNNPSRGMALTPTKRILTPDFSPNYEPRKTKDNKEMPLSRSIRTEMLNDGKITDLKTTQLLSYFLIFHVHDINGVHDVENNLHNSASCCKPEGKADSFCAPVKIPYDDPVHRFSGVRCQNLTKPQSFQYFGCLDFGTTEFARIEFTTPVIDLSNVYGDQFSRKGKIRTYFKGLVKVELDNGKEFPPSNPILEPKINKCLANQPPREKRCHLHIMNGALGMNIMSILFYRQHNYIAKQLAQLNPCWSDDRIFYTAKDINIAIVLQIIFCEMLPILLGRDNMLNEGLSCPDGFRDVYDENIMPQLSEEFIYVLRWFHTIQDTDIKLYDDDGNYLNKTSILNFSTRTGWLPLDDNINKVFQGSFRQPGGKADSSIDPGMGQDVMRGGHFASDVATSDLEKGRLFGFQPYVKYRELCSKKKYETFASLNDVMSKEKIYRLKETYKNVEDVDLMSGIWVENMRPGGMVPHTMHCLMVEQLKRTIASDRHWYERSNRPHAFTLEQLKAIKKTTIAGVMCANADGVTKIQPHAFHTISPDNPLTNCSSSEMGNINLTSWKDSSLKKQC